MKKTILALAFLAAFGAQAQTTSTSSSSPTSTATASPVVSGISGSSSSTASSSPTASASSTGNMNSSGANVNGVYAGSDPNNQAQQSITFNSTSPDNQTSTNHQTYVGQESVNYSGTQTIKNVPAIAMSGPASGPCTGVSGGLGLAGPGWGLGLNGSSVMADCRLRENTRVLGMAMQSVDGSANPQEKGELLVMFMEAARGLAAYNNQIISSEVKGK